MVNSVVFICSFGTSSSTTGIRVSPRVEHEQKVSNTFCYEAVSSHNPENNLHRIIVKPVSAAVHIKPQRNP